MGNFAQGTIKLHGKIDNIYRFFKDYLEYHVVDVGHVNADVQMDPGRFWVKVSYRRNYPPDPCSYSFGVKDTWAAIMPIKYWLEDYCGDYKPSLIDKSLSVDCDDPDEDVVFVGRYSEKYGLETSFWEKMSEKYDLDIRIYVVESGNGWTELVTILKGKKTQDQLTAYESYDSFVWNVAFPYLGG